MSFGCEAIVPLDFHGKFLTSDEIEKLEEDDRITVVTEASHWLGFKFPVCVQEYTGKCEEELLDLKRIHKAMKLPERFVYTGYGYGDELEGFYLSFEDRSKKNKKVMRTEFGKPSRHYDEFQHVEIFCKYGNQPLSKQVVDVFVYKESELPCWWSSYPAGQEFLNMENHLLDDDTELLCYYPDSKSLIEDISPHFNHFPVDLLEWFREFDEFQKKNPEVLASFDF